MPALQEPVYRSGVPAEGDFYSRERVEICVRAPLNFWKTQWGYRTISAAVLYRPKRNASGWDVYLNWTESRSEAIGHFAAWGSGGNVAGAGRCQSTTNPGSGVSWSNKPAVPARCLNALPPGIGCKRVGPNGANACLFYR